MDNRLSRRQLLRGGGLAAVSLVAAGTPFTAYSQEEESNEKKNKVSPVEDLMREHGALNRMLLIYEQQQDRLAIGNGVQMDVIGQVADLIRRFIEGYHEKLEEEFLFRRFKKAGQLTDLVDTLKRQHDAGRRVTEAVLAQVKQGDPKQDSDRQRLADSLRQFIRMYRPHEAREDTVLFPAFKELLAPAEYKAFGEQFEDREHKLFGEGGFEDIVIQLAALEKKVNLYDLDQFTPDVK